MRAGETIADRFDLESPIGAGGMGTVWRARDRVSGEPVAVKTLFDEDAASGERFEREAQLLAALRHPGIVRYIAHGRTPDDRGYLAMEWLEGADLTARLADVRLTLRESLALAARAADALAAAHALGIVHRDIKPSNLFLVGGDAQRVKVIDFGVAHAHHAGRARTLTGLVLGTPGYMAPEQARGARDVDARADVFSLGCVLYECLTGRAPFLGDHAVAVLTRVLLEEPPDVRALRPEVPVSLANLVAALLAKEPARRPRDGGAVARAIEALPALGDDGDARPDDVVAAVSSGERRVLSVVLASLPPPARTAATTGTLVLEDPVGGPDALQRAAAACDGTVETLADGSVVVTLTRGAVATDQAARAARCALALRGVLPGVPVAVATGAAELSGRLPVGAVIDRAVALAHAPNTPDAGPVRLDEVTASLLDARFDVARDGDAATLWGERAIADGARAVLGVATPCVGRERELVTLDAIVADCLAERAPRAALVTGAAGLGKSRLRHEWLRRLDAMDAPPAVWVARGDAASAGTPFGLLAQWIRHAAHLADNAPLPARQAALLAWTARHLPAADAARAAEFLGEIAGTGAPDAASPALRAARRDPVLLGDQVRRAALDVLAAECAARPVVLVLEDLHWGDLPSVALADAALRTLEEAPLMVLALARPEVHEAFPRLWAGRDVTELRLGGLSRKAAERLVRAVLGDAEGAHQAARLAERAEGNPLLLEELLRATRAAGGDGASVPETVQALVEARLDAVAPAARRVLRAASVYGAACWRSGVVALLDAEATAGDALSERLDDLARRELLAPRAASRFEGEVEYGFRHELLQRAAYATLTARDRRVAHALAGAWLERAGETDALALAEHFERGHAPARAAEWFLRAAERALAGNDFDAAIAAARRGLECDPTARPRGALHLLLAETCFLRHDHGDALLHGTQAAALLEPATSPWFRAVAQAAEAGSARDRTVPIRAMAGQLAELDARAQAEPMFLACAARVVRAAVDVGEPDAARAVAVAVVRYRDHAGAAEPDVAAAVFAAQAARAAAAGDFRAAVEASAQRAACAEACGDVRGASRARADASEWHCALGAFAEAERVARRALSDATAVAVGADREHGRALLQLAHAVAGLGRHDEAHAALGGALAAARAARDAGLEARVRLALGELLWAAGNHAPARREAERLHRGLRRWPRLAARVHALRARLALAERRPVPAMAHAADATRALAARAEPPASEVRVRLAAAEVLFGAECREPAHAELRRARERLAALAEGITDAAARARFLRDVPDHARITALAAAWGLA